MNPATESPGAGIVRAWPTGEVEDGSTKRYQWSVAGERPPAQHLHGGVRRGGDRGGAGRHDRRERRVGGHLPVDAGGAGLGARVDPRPEDELGRTVQARRDAGRPRGDRDRWDRSVRTPRRDRRSRPPRLRSRPPSGTHAASCGPSPVAPSGRLTEGERAPTPTPSDATAGMRRQPASQNGSAGDEVLGPRVVADERRGGLLGLVLEAGLLGDLEPDAVAAEQLRRR